MSAPIKCLWVFLMFAAFSFPEEVFGQCAVTANFTHNPDQECAAIPIFFNASSSTGSGLIYIWDFDDGTAIISTTDDTITHRFYAFNDANCGVKKRFFVQLTVVDTAGCMDDIVRIVTVTPQPLAALLDSLDHNWIICLDPLDTIFGDTLWVTEWIPFEHCVNYFNIDWGDGTDTLNLNINSFPLYHVYTSTGIFQLNYYVHGVHDCHWDTNYQVIVQTFPTATLSVNPNDPGCAPYNVEFIIGDYENNWQESVYSLDFGDGSPPLVWDSDQMAQYDTISYTYIQTHCVNPAASSFGYRAILQINDNNLCGDTTIYSQHIEVLEAPVASFTASRDSICINEQICFSNYTVAGYTSGCSKNTTYLWDFGDSVASLDVNPCHTFTSPGIYQVNLIAYSSTFCYHDTSMTVYVFDDPIAAIIADTEICFRDTSFFSDGSLPGSGYIINWIWDFGDGNMSYEQNPIHVYTSPGVYVVSLIVENIFGCIDDTIITVEVFRLPSADFTDSTHCNFTTYFTNLSVANAPGQLNYSWDFGDGNTSSVQHPIHDYTNFGVYSVILTITNTNGCQDMVSNNIVVYPVPIASFTSDTACATTTTQFTDLSACDHGTIVSWLWDFGDGSGDTEQNPVHIYNAPGTYPVTLVIISSEGCQDTSYGYAEVLPLPVASFSAPVTCDDDTVYFTDLSTANTNSLTQWYWDFGDGYVSFDQNPVHKYAYPGFYIVYLMVENSGGCIDDTFALLEILSSPIAGFYHSAPVCLNDSVYFHDGSDPGLDTIVSWLWDFGDGYYSSARNPVHFYQTSDTFNVQLLVTNANGCISEFGREIIVAQYPNPDFEYEFPCWINTTEFIDLSFNPGIGTITDWIWDFGDGYSSYVQNPYHKYAVSGQYQVSLTVINEHGCSEEITKLVQIYEGPRAEFTTDSVCLDAPISFTDLSVPYNEIVAWYWDFGDPTSGNQNYSTLQHPVHIFNIEGFYIVNLTVTDIHGCFHTSSHEYYAEPNPLVAFYFDGANCPYGEIYFFDQTQTFLSDISMWLWDFGDGTTEIIYSPANPNVSHIYSAVGTYNVSLMVYTVSGCFDVSTDLVFIVPGPDADFQYENTCIDEQTQFFDNTGANDIITWEWDFGDAISGQANYSVAQNPTHVYTYIGSYEVTLIVGNSAGCLDTIVKTVTITPLPPVDFYWDAACEDEITRFYTDTSVVNINMIIYYLWDFGDGNYSNLQNPGHIFDGDGVYNVTLTLTDTSHCENLFSTEVEVFKKPYAFYDISEPTCYGDSIFFNNMSTSNVGYINRWVWDYDDGSDPDTIYFPDDPNPFHLYSQVGIYSPVLTVTNNKGCSDSYSRELIIRIRPEAEFTFSYPCEQSPVLFTDLSVTNGQGNPSTYIWNFGDPASGVYNTSNLQNPEHTFSYGDSVYHVTLIIENFFLCSDTMVKTIYVNDGPPVDFMWTNACENGITYFYPDSSVINVNTISGWLWDFGDGSFGYEPISAHIYDGPGTYFVSLTIQDSSACAGTHTRMVVVSPAPLAIFYVPEVNCQNIPVYFDENSSSQQSYVISWHWDFGDGVDTIIFFPDDPDVMHTYLQSGTYEVSLSVTSADSCADSFEQYIMIESAPIALFEWEGICEAIDYEFSDLSGTGNGFNIISWYWEFDDPASGIYNTSDLQHPDHNFTEAGVYAVSLNVTDNNGCTGTVVIPVTVSDGPPADFFFTNTCENTPTAFTIDSANTNISSIILYQWNFGDGSPISNEMNPSHTYVVCGTYEVSLTVYDSYGCDLVVEHDVLVTQGPVALFDSDANCEGIPIQFLDYSYNPGNGLITEWLWDFDDGNTSSIQNPMHTFSDSGLYDVNLTVINQYGCSNSIILPLNVFQKPEADFDLYISACEGGVVQFYDATISQVQIVSWDWEFENGYHSNLQNPAHTFSQTNYTYMVSLIVTDNKGCTDTIVKEVFVPGELQIVIYEEHNCFMEEMEFEVGIIAPLPNVLDTYDWNFGDPASGTANLSQATQPTHIFTAPGTYYVTVQVKDMNGCDATLMKEIRVYNLAEPDFIYEFDLCDSICYLYDMTINNGEEIYYWEWDFGDGSPIMTVFTEDGGDVTHKYSDIGVYDVTLTVMTYNGCKVSIVHPIVREACLNAAFIASDANCQYDNVFFTDSSSIDELIQSWTWLFGDGRDTSYSQKCNVVSHKYKLAGDFTVNLIVEAIINGFYFCDTMQELVHVKPSPLADFINEAGCAGTPLSFIENCLSNGSQIINWHWDFGTASASDTSFLSQPEFIYDAQGIYKVILQVENAYGCSDSKVKEIEILTAPEAAFEHSLACAGDPVIFTDISSAFESEIISWKWRFGPDWSEDSSSIQDPLWTFSIEGQRDVELMVKNAIGCKDVVRKSVNVFPKPIARFHLLQNYYGQQGKVLIEDRSEGADYCSWNLGDGTTYDNIFDPIEHTYEYEGTYIIEQITWNEYGCLDTTTQDFDFLFKSLFIPNALNPNGANYETRFFTPKGRNLLFYHIGVYNAWGETIWESTALDPEGRPTESWDGTYEGKLVPSDVYVWKAEAMFLDGTVWDGDAVGNTEGLSKSTSGLVVVVR